MSFLPFPTSQELSTKAFYRKGTLGFDILLFFPELCGISFCVRCVLPWKDKWVCPHTGPASFPEGFLRKPHGGDHSQHLTVLLLFVKLTVHVPLDASGREFQGFVDLLQDSLQLLLLSNLWLRDLSNVQLLTLKFLWGDKGKTAVIASHRQPWLLYVRSHIYSLNKHVRAYFALFERCFIALHRCVFSQVEGETLHQQKDYDSFIVIWNQTRNISEGCRYVKDLSPPRLTVALLAPVLWKPCDCVLNPQIIRSLRSGAFHPACHIWTLFYHFGVFPLLFNSAFSKDISVLQLDSLLSFP